MNIKAIQLTDELRQQFVSLLGTVVQGGSMISEHDNRCMSELFYAPGGMLRKNTPLEVRAAMIDTNYYDVATFCMWNKPIYSGKTQTTLYEQDQIFNHIQTYRKTD